MKLFFDQNLSYQLVRRLADLYPASQHVRDVGMREARNEMIWSHAREHGFVIVSKDVDFHQRALRLGHPPKVVWLRIGNCSTSQVEALLRRRHQELLAFERHPLRSTLIVS